jgi:hypothetical protein
MELLDREVARARRYARPLSVILGRVRRAGEVSSEALASGWMALARDVDFGARLDDSGWAMALPETGRAGAAVAAERFRRGLESLSGASAQEGCPLTLGVVTHPYHGTTASALLETADQLSRQRGGAVTVAEFPRGRGEERL